MLFRIISAIRRRLAKKLQRYFEIRQMKHQLEAVAVSLAEKEGEQRSLESQIEAMTSFITFERFAGDEERFNELRQLLQAVDREISNLKEMQAKIQLRMQTA